jgi:hypothetical protein
MTNTRETVEEMAVGLPKRFNRWEAASQRPINCLVQSVMHPICRTRLNNTVAVIRLKELHRGFRVESAEAVPIDSLEDTQSIRDQRLEFTTSFPDRIVCSALIFTEARNGAMVSFKLAQHIGDYRHLSIVKSNALIEKNRQEDIFRELNNE